MALPVKDRREVTTWSPFAELERASRALDRFLEEALGSGWPNWWPSFDLTGVAGEFRPPADVEETDDAYVVEVELPGVSKRDIDVEVVGRRLTVSGERKERERTGVLRRRTRTVGRFHYEVTLPTDVNEGAVSATLTDGVLTVTVPKATPDRIKRRRVPVE